MDLVPGFQELLQGLSGALTAPSFASLCMIISGWLFSGRGIVTRMIVAAGTGATKHFSSYHRVLSAASWSLDGMGLAVFTMMLPFLGDVVMLGLDDTLARKRGLRMFGTGMHHDPLSSTRSLAFVRWGHSWVVLGIVLGSATASNAWDSKNLGAGAGKPSRRPPRWPRFSTRSSFSGSSRKAIGSGSHRLTVGTQPRRTHHSRTRLVRCDGPACGSTF